MWICRWCSAATHLVASSLESWPTVRRFNIFLGFQLLDTFTFPKGESFSVEAATAGAAVLHMSNQHQSGLPESASDPLRIRTVARNGSLLAEHLVDFAPDFLPDPYLWLAGGELASPG